MRALLALPLALALIPGCIVPPTNAFDPQAPAELQRPARLSGVVVDDVGPVVGAKLTLGVRTETSADDGAYAFEDVVPGVSTLRVEHPAHNSSVRDVLLIAGDDRTEDVVLAALVDGSHVHGVALQAARLDDTAPDHSGVVVEVVGVGLRTITNATGDYDLTLAPGTYSFTLSAPEHLAATLPSVVVSAALTEVETVTLAVNPGSLSGQVTLEELIPGTPVHGGVLVSVADTTVTTGADDAFSVSGLAAGPAVVRFSRTDYESAERLAVVKSGSAVPLEPLRLARAQGGLAGEVDLLDVDDDSGVTVALRGAAGTFAAVSASDGAFTFAAVPSGSYDLSASRVGFVAVAGASVEIVQGATTVLAEPLLLTGALADFVIDDGAAFTNSATVDVSIASNSAVQMRLGLSDDLSGATTVAFDPSSTFSIDDGNGDGGKTVFLELIDADGVVSGPFEASIILDRLPPGAASLSINGGNAFTNNDDGIVALSLFATDAGSGVESMQLDTDGTFTAPFADFQTTLAFPLGGVVDGLRTLRVRFRDRAGNETDPNDAAVATVTLDRVAPVVGALVIRDGVTERTDVATSSFVALEISATNADDAVAMALSTDPLFPVETFEAFAAGRAFALLPGDGTRTVAVKLKDAAGNIGNALAVAIRVDSRGPRGAFVQIAGGADVTDDLTTALSLFADDFAAVRISVDGVFDDVGEQYSETVPTTVELANRDGSQTVWAQFQDDAGNESDVVADSVVFDGTGPVLDADPALADDAIVIAFDGTAAGAAFTDSISVVVSFDVDGADEMALSTDADGVTAESFQPFAGVVTVLLPGGDCDDDASCKRVCAVFRDRAGNASSQVCDDIGLDTAAPATPLFVERDDIVNDTAFTIHLVDKAEDAFFDHYEILISPGAPVFAVAVAGAAAGGAIPFAVTLTAPAPGTEPADAAESNLIRMVAVDRAGNRSPESALTIVVDDVAPDAPTLAGVPAVLNAETISVNFLLDNPADDDATFDHYQIDTTLLPAPFDSFQRDGIIVTLLPDQRNTIVVRAVDAAGNISAPDLLHRDEAAVREDSTPPSSPSIAPGAAVVRAGAVEIYVSVPSVDTFDVDGAGPLAPTIAALDAYAVKDGRGLGFQRQGAGEGPFVAVVRRDQTNEICVQGIDAAGNTSDSDCVDVDEATSSFAVDADDAPDDVDIYGDFVVFANDQKQVFLRDLTGQLGDKKLNPFDFPEQRPRGRLSMVGDNNDVFIVYDTVADTVQLNAFDISRSATPPTFASLSFAGFASTLGTAAPFGGAAEIVYAVGAAGPGTVDLRRRSAVLPLAADVQVITTGIVLCDNTLPVVAVGVVVWCEVQSGEAVVRRKRTVPGAIDTLSRLGAELALERQGVFDEDPPSVVQPVVTDELIAWVEDVAGVSRLLVLQDPQAEASAAVELPNVDGLALDIDKIEDASGAKLALLQLRSGALTADVVVLDAIQRSLRVLTTSLPPERNVRIDGRRVAFRDSSIGQTIVAADVSGQRWVSGTPDLAFDPAASADAIAWIESRNDSLRLLARSARDTGSPIVEVDDPPVVFSQPATADPAWAVGGGTVAWLSAGGVPGPFTLTAKEITSGAIVTLATDAAGAFALDPDGDQVVYVDAANRIVRRSLTFTPPSTLSVGALSVLDNVDVAVPVPFVDVDDAMVVWQLGGDAEVDGADGAGGLRCRDATIGVARDIPIGAVIGRGPKLGRAGGAVLLAYTEDGTSGRVCPLTCAAGGATCTTRIPVGSSVPGVIHNKIDVDRTGLVAYISHELNGSGEVVLFEPLTGRRTFATNDSSDQSALSVSDGRVLYVDPQLGTFDIWEVTR